MIGLNYSNLGTPSVLREILPLDNNLFQVPSLQSIKNNIRSVGTTDYARDIVHAKQKSQEQQKVQQQNGQQQNGSSTVKQAAASGISALSSTLTNNLSNNIFGDDTELGKGMGTLFSQGVSSATDTLSTNLLKGTTLTEGLGQNVGESLAGAAVGIAGNLIGKGINSIGGDSMLSRGIGQGVATGIGTIGGQAVSNLFKGKDAFQGIKDSVSAIKAAKAAKAAGVTGDALKTATGLSNMAKWNLAGIGGQIVGSGLQAAFGPSHEYGGRYGNITQGMDTAYDLIQTGIGFVPGWGTIAAGAMALNKGLSNIFGSTDGMTKQDAILGSAFMPAPVKWLNMWGSSKTGNFNNQSWQNTEKVNSFMGNAFGNLGERFDQAREEAGKVYGTFSQGAKRRAQENIDFANTAWGTVLGMADQNEIQKIRSQYMSSINNQRYAQEIGGVWQPLARGKYGMKILNNATNHNIGQRLLSGAALIDNKQMILCNVLD